MVGINEYKLPLTGLIGFVACMFSLFAVVLPQAMTFVLCVSRIAQRDKH